MFRQKLRRLDSRLDTGAANGQVARVRYTGFPDPDERDNSGIRIKTRRTKSVTGPSGRRYTFRDGRGTSQWLPINRSCQEDVEAFKETEDFEVDTEV
jgi:hypothetical protein